MRAPSEMDVNVAWTDKEGNEEQVENETYPSVQKREADPKDRDYRPNNNSPLGETYDVGGQDPFRQDHTGSSRTTIRRRAPALSQPGLHHKPGPL